MNREQPGAAAKLLRRTRKLTERMKDSVKAWLTPGLIIQMVGILLMLGGAWAVSTYRLDHQDARYQELKSAIADQGKAIKDQVDELRAEVREVKNAQADVVRAQERMEALKGRVDILERFTEAQTQFNAMLAARVARLER